METLAQLIVTFIGIAIFAWLAETSKEENWISEEEYELRDRLGDY